MEEIQEQWMHKIRKLAPKLQDAEFQVFVAEAEMKKLNAKLRLIATSKGCKTVSAQEVFAENTNEMYEARINLGKNKGALMGLKVQLKALEVGFDEWRTKMVNSREEQKRYGA